MKSPEYNRPLHAMALVTAGMTFLLIFMGGLVTSHSAGMSVPDWPNSYGYNMFLFPPRLWVDGILFEHTHRLMGTVVGFCATVTSLVAWAPGRTMSGRRKVIWVLAILTGLNALGTLAMVLWPMQFHLPSPLSAGKVIAQGAVSETGIALCGGIALLCRNPELRRWTRWLTIGLLTMVIIQGLLGGLRVVLVKLDLAIVHACLAQAVLCAAALVCIVTSRWWIEAPNLSVAAPRLLPLAIACVAIVYAQLILGAVMRHNQAGLAIPDLPLAYGKLLPPTNSQELLAANHQLIHLIDSGANPRDRDLPKSVTMFQVWINFVHRMGALVVTAAIVTLAIEIFRRGSLYPREIKKPALLLVFLLALQIILGVLTILLRKPADVASSHVAVGALVLVTSFTLSVRGLRLYSSAMRGRSSRLDALRSACPFAESDAAVV